MDIFGLEMTKKLRKLPKNELDLVQAEIAFSYGMYKKTLELFDNIGRLRDKYGADIQWPDEEVEKWFLSRGKVRILSDPSLSAEVHRTLREWQSRNGL